MLDPQTPKVFPREAIFVKDPMTGHELDMQPLLLLLHKRYQGDKVELSESLEEVAAYLMRENTDCDSASKLRRVVGIVNSLLDAVDGITVRRTSRV